MYAPYLYGYESLKWSKRKWWYKNAAPFTTSAKILGVWHGSLAEGSGYCSMNNGEGMVKKACMRSISDLEHAKYWTEASIGLKPISVCFHPLPHEMKCCLTTYRNICTYIQVNDHVMHTWSACQYNLHSAFRDAPDRSAYWFQAQSVSITACTNPQQPGLCVVLQRRLTLSPAVYVTFGPAHVQSVSCVQYYTVGIDARRLSNARALTATENCATRLLLKKALVRVFY